MSSTPLQRRADAPTTQEYGCDFRRILPWGSTGPSDTGMGVCTVAPGTTTTPHSHADHEHFYVVSGTGLLHLDGESTAIGPGDAFVVDSHRRHHFENTSAREELEMVSVWSMGAFGAAP
ncbi:cupin domain-containing protein [Streptomyces angustmyceticus]|uniref:cupin domain-containing protein n=1 Tax=Streptomyces angustmyceticus TaxID=285578 RepID=UPI003450B684